MPPTGTAGQSYVDGIRFVQARFGVPITLKVASANRRSYVLHSARIKTVISNDVRAVRMHL